MSQSYRSDLTDEQWEVIKTLIPPPKTGGRPRTVEMRGVINEIFYILVAGCAWCLLPHDFPKWKTVYHYFRQWRIDGDWERIHEQLRKWVRAIEDHHPSFAQVKKEHNKFWRLVKIWVDGDTEEKNSGNGLWTNIDGF